MNIIYFTGNVGKDAETRDTKSGSVCSFSVAVRQGISRDAPSEWYRCTIWGQRGQNLASHITKGAKVAVAGTLEIGEYEGRAQYNVNVLEIDPFCGGGQAGRSDSNAGNGQRSAGNAGSSNAGNRQAGSSFSAQHAAGRGPFDSDLDDDVPF